MSVPTQKIEIKFEAKIRCQGYYRQKTKKSEWHAYCQIDMYFRETPEVAAEKEFDYTYVLPDSACHAFSIYAEKTFDTPEDAVQHMKEIVSRRFGNSIPISTSTHIDLE